jgi:hypothetical protein
VKAFVIAAMIKTIKKPRRSHRNSILRTSSFQHSVSSNYAAACLYEQTGAPQKSSKSVEDATFCFIPGRIEFRISVIAPIVMTGGSHGFPHSLQASSGMMQLCHNWSLSHSFQYILVSVVVQAIYYKPEGRLFISRSGNLIFSIYLILQATLGLGVYSTTNRNEY